MTTKLQAELERVINDWLEATCEDEGRPLGDMYDELAEDMAQAATMVYDACFKGQEFAEQEGA